MRSKKAAKKKPKINKKEISALISKNVRGDLSICPETMLNGLKNIFKNYQDFKDYKLMALSEFQDLSNNKHASLKKIIPERVKVVFSSKVNSVQVYFPRYTGEVIIEHPSNKLTLKQKADLRHKLNIIYGPLIKVNEDVIADAWAIKMKVLGKKKTLKK